MPLPTVRISAAELEKQMIKGQKQQQKGKSPGKPASSASTAGSTKVQPRAPPVTFGLGAVAADTPNPVATAGGGGVFAAVKKSSAGGSRGVASAISTVSLQGSTARLSQHAQPPTDPLIGRDDNDADVIDPSEMEDEEDEWAPRNSAAGGPPSDPLILGDAADDDEYEEPFPENVTTTQSSSGKQFGFVGTSPVRASGERGLADTSLPLGASAFTGEAVTKEHHQPQGTSRATGGGGTAHLTKEQLLQAIQHLLDTDSSFITRLHEAYVDSLNRSLKR